MSTSDAPNYFAPPETDVTSSGRDPVIEHDAMVMIRREYLPHERQIRALSSCFLAFCGLFGTPGVVLIFQFDGLWLGLLVLLISFIFGAIGFGLFWFRTWSRLVTFLGAAVSVGLLGYTIFQSFGRVHPGRLGLLIATCAIPWWIVKLTTSPAAGLIFSPQYREVVRRTPKLRPSRDLPNAIWEGITLGYLLIILVFWMMIILKVR